MNERLTEQDLDEIAARLAVWRARAEIWEHDARFVDARRAASFLQGALDYAERLLQDVRAARQATP